MNYEYRYKGDDYSIVLQKAEEGFKLSYSDTEIPLVALKVDDHTFMLSANGVKKIVHVAQTDGKIYVHVDGSVHLLEDIVAQEQEAGGAEEIMDGVQKIKAPMPGKVVKIPVEEDQSVEAGTAVCIVEAMKMENVVIAKIDGVIKNVAFKAGDLVDTDAVILEIVAEE